MTFYFLAARGKEAVRSNVGDFADQGFMIFTGLIADDLTDHIVADTRCINVAPHHYFTTAHGAHIDLSDGLGVGCRIQDLFVASQVARDAVGYPAWANFLSAIFEDDVIAMESLYFEYGSQQGIPLDTANVSSSGQLYMAATWIVLEYVKVGFGELIYSLGAIVSIILFF